MLASRFQSLIVQPTTLCNLNCSYCYLPAAERKTRLEMSVPVAEALAEGISDQGGDVVDVVWHGGEPLTTQRDRFRALLEPFEPLRHQGRVRHFVQTNATLIDDAWCDFFHCYGFRVGVSIDGPEAVNRSRTDWGNRPSFDRAMRGISRLRAHSIAFSAICVVTVQTVTKPESLLDFFEDLGTTSVGFNIEELEGANDDRQTMPPELVRFFWRKMFDRLDAGSPLRVREADRLLGYLADARAGRKDRRDTVLHDPIPTVGTNGDVVVLSPELLGVKDDRYGDFVIGNVLDQTLASILDRAADTSYVREYTEGVRRCRQACEFFAFCQGGQASNKYFEHGDFTVTETAYCRNSKIELARALGEKMGV
ncbi:cyclophane-forming radical SAM peptide maturase AmcB [Nocardiopsis sp. CNS-639]|uniref:cyclophane-forming radical SAM peptide maturase AmcB n=1 Tax=Nocardiopsis sp. CNS-639 TaxID=1169153 RepID=UPI0003A2910D|nr:cyclophane-forming radical SAM peptide maturase AmcB [Nocardiopsis sp. CNS-639]